MTWSPFDIERQAACMPLTTKSLSRTLGYERKRLFFNQMSIPDQLADIDPGISPDSRGAETSSLQPASEGLDDVSIKVSVHLIISSHLILIS